MYKDPRAQAKAIGPLGFQLTSGERGQILEPERLAT